MHKRKLDEKKDARIIRTESQLKGDFNRKVTDSVN